MIRIITACASFMGASAQAGTRSEISTDSRHFYLWFKKTISSGERDALHEKNKVRLLQRGKNLPVDLVHLGSREISRKASLKEFCDPYLRSGLVLYCEPVRVSTPPVEPCAQMAEFKTVVSRTLSSGQCELVPKSPMTAPPGLTPLWAQMRIGSDLVKAEMKDLKDLSGIGSRTVNVGNIDGGFESSASTARGNSWEMLANQNGNYRDHGTKVVNLIAGRENYGVSASARISFIRDGYSYPGHFVMSLDQAISEKPEVLNLELHTLAVVRGVWGGYFGKSEVLRASISEAAKSMIVVAAAGNHYPQGSGEAVIQDENVIVVGSSDPFGLVSDFSDESPDVTILAPSDHYLKVTGVNGDVFGGTSGAAPMVSATVADLKSILGELTGHEASRILKMSASRLAVTERRPQKNGAGQLNSFRALKVAARLKAMGWPKDRDALMKRAEKWDFKELSRMYLRDAQAHLTQDGCASFKMAFEELRKSVLLDESLTEARETLAILYEAQGYPVEAIYLRNLEPEEAKRFVKAPEASRSCPGNSGCDQNIAPTPPQSGLTPSIRTSQGALNRARELLF